MLPIIFKRCKTNIKTYNKTSPSNLNKWQLPATETLKTLELETRMHNLVEWFVVSAICST